MFDDPDDDTAVIFRDTLFLALLGFVAVVVILISHINPKAQASTKDAEPPGNVIVEARWADGLPVDADLWVQGPDGNAVGYSRKSGPLFNLLRDDLGSAGDIGPLNYETTYSRGIVAGEYTVNVHAYRGKYPVEVFVVASVKRSPNESAQPLVKATVTLRREGEELTAFRFRLTEVAQHVHLPFKFTPWGFSLFRGGAFTPEDAMVTGTTLGIIALGLPAYV